MIRGLGRHLLDIEIAVDAFKGQQVCVLRINLYPSDSNVVNLPFQLMIKRRQIPIRPAFAMTMHQ